MKIRGVVLALLLFGVLAGIGYALTPPPPPPVPQNLGIFDTSIDHLNTTVTDQSACRVCHQTSGTNISGGYNNTIGGVPTRHHNLLPENKINPYTNTTFGCQDCHPSTPGIGNGILLDRSCQDCHNGTSFWGDSIGGHVGNFSRPHHVDTGYDDANIGQPAQNRTCNFCHGSFVDNYNDGHYIPSYNTSFMITPFATFKATNFSQPDGLGGNKTWGGCESCHLANPNATPYPISSNYENHHKEILGFAMFGGQSQYENASTGFANTPGGSCTPCHPGGHDRILFITPEQCDGIGSKATKAYSSNGIYIGCLIYTDTIEAPVPNPFTGENLTNAMEVRNSTREQADFAIGALEPGTTNVSINGTGCEKCHSVKSLHNIQFNYSQNGPQGFGHINNNTDCYGCHNSWLPADTWVPGALIPTLDSVSPSVIAVGVPTTLTITGSNFVNPDGNYTPVVTVDGVIYTPTSLTATQTVVNIPALAAGVHQLQLVKGGDTLSKLWVLTVVSSPSIATATLRKGTITITGTNFGTQPANAQLYVSVSHGGNQITSTSITSWSTTQIKAKNSAAAIGDIVTVITADSGETTAAIT